MTRLGLLVLASTGLAVVPVSAQKSFSDGYSFLKAVKERDGATVEQLLAEPSTTVINTRDTGSGDTALHTVARGRDSSWLLFLLGKGARPDVQNKEGFTPLAITAQLGWVEGAATLLDRRASVDLPNNRGETPLIYAVQNRDLAMVRLLLSRGANPKKTDSAAGYSALDYARRDSRAAPILKVLEAPAAKPVRAVAGPNL